jgi:hypothetical protein
MAFQRHSWSGVVPAVPAGTRRHPRGGLVAWFAAVAVATLGAAAAAGSEPASRSDAGVLQMCTGVYALCDAALCKPIPAGKGAGGGDGHRRPMAHCECVVENGPNLGPGPCSLRTPNGQHIMSTYSFALPDKHFLSCPAGGERTVCFGYPCEIDAQHPDRAVCTCPIISNSAAFMTQGGDCNPAQCTKNLWQGGTPGEYAVINKKFAAATGQTPPAACSAPAKP